MSDVDPRVWAIRRPLAACVLVIALTLLFLGGNAWLQRAGLFTGDVILREDDPYRVMDAYVHEQKAHEGFDGEEIIPFFLNTGVRATADLERVLRFMQAAKATFGDTLLSLSEIPAYEDTGAALRDEPWVTESELAQADFTVRAWKDKVARDPSVFGLFVDRQFRWTAVFRYLPPGHDEITEFRRTTEFLEGRRIPWWEWLYKRDVQPQDPGMGVGGWVMGRGLIDQGLNVDLLTLVFLGVVLTLPVFWGALGSLRHTVLGVSLLLVLGFLWSRGILGLLGERERVFLVIAYANVIVQGVSFALHKCVAFADSTAPDRAGRWRQAMAVDGVILTTGLIAIFGFATLWSFGLRPVRELGLASAYGVVLLLILALVFLPALDLLGAREAHVIRGSQPGRIHTLVQRLLDSMIAHCTRATTWLAVGKRPWLLLTGVCGVFVIVALLFTAGRIQSRTRALVFLAGTSVERQARFLNQPGNLGFEFLDLLVELGGDGDLYEPRFLARAWAYQTALRQLPEARETASILSTVHRIARESFKKPFPETREEIDAAFVLIESRLAPAVQRQLYFPRGVRISVSYGFDDSVALARFCEAALALARQEFPDLKVSAFNTVPIYPRVDHYVRQGKVVNVFTSQIGVALLCAGVLAWRNWGQRGPRLAPLRGGLVMSIPLFTATAVMGLIMWALGVSLDMATAPIGALAINAAGDFSLYFALTYQHVLKTHTATDALTTTMTAEGTIIVADCLLNTLCFLPLITSQFQPIRHIGWMMGVMLVTCAVATLLVMAALLPRCVIAQEKIT